jgi:hypothetical protein
MFRCRPIQEIKGFHPEHRGGRGESHDNAVKNRMVPIGIAVSSPDHDRQVFNTARKILASGSECG